MNPFFSTYLLKRLSKPDDARSTPQAPPPRQVRIPVWAIYLIGLLLLSIITLAVAWYAVVSIRA